MLAKPSKKRPSQSLCIGRSSSREYQTDPEKQVENSVFEFFNRIGQEQPFVTLPRSGPTGMLLGFHSSAISETHGPFEFGKNMALTRCSWHFGLEVFRGYK